MSAKLQCTAAEFVLELERQSAQAETLTSGLSESALNWQPDGGRAWSIGQCMDHLAATNRLYLEAMRDAVQRNEDQISPSSGIYQPAGWPSRRFIESMEPPPKRKFRAFRRITPRPSGHQVEVVLSGFLEAQQGLLEFVSKCRDMDLGSLRFHNPFLKGVRLTVSSGLLLVGAHNRRHLWQAENVKRSAAFPG